MKDNNIHELRKKSSKLRKMYKSTPKERCQVIIHDFEKPIKKSMYNKTRYILYDCTFLKINGKSIGSGYHVIQLSFKVAFAQLYDYLKELDLLEEKNIRLWIVKNNNYSYTFNCEKAIRLKMDKKDTDIDYNSNIHYIENREQ